MAVRCRSRSGASSGAAGSIGWIEMNADSGSPAVDRVDPRDVAGDRAPLLEPPHPLVHRARGQPGVAGEVGVDSAAVLGQQRRAAPVDVVERGTLTGSRPIPVTP